MSRARLLGLAAAASVLVVASPAAAFERQWRVGGGVGPVLLSRADFSGISTGVEVDLTYGLSDQFNLLVEGSITPIPGFSTATHTTLGDQSAPPPETSRTYAVTTGTVGIAYTLDVLRYVPYAGLFAGMGRVSYGSSAGGAITGSEGADTSLDVGLALGLDFQWTREVTIGLALRGHEFLLGNETASAGQAWLRAEYTWGY